MLKLDKYTFGAWPDNTKSSTVKREGPSQAERSVYSQVMEKPVIERMDYAFEICLPSKRIINLFVQVTYGYKLCPFPSLIQI